MAAVATINGQAINSSNAYEFYYNICQGKDGFTQYDQDGPEAKQCKKFLSLGQIQHCETDSTDYEADGEKEVDTQNYIEKEDRQNDHEGSNQAAAVTSAAVAGISAVTATLAGLKVGEKLSKITPWIALGFSAAAAIMGGISIGQANMYDNDLPTKENLAKQADTDLATIKAKSDMMKTHQESLDQDSSEYQAFQDEMLAAHSEDMNESASLQMDLYDAMALGDEEAAAEIQAQLDELDGREYDMGRLSELRMRSEEYKTVGFESVGVDTSAKKVEEFLNTSKSLANTAKVIRILYDCCAACCALSAIGSFVGIKAVWDAIPAGIAAAVYVGAGVCFAISAGKMGDKYDKENTCSEAGAKYKDPLAQMRTEWTNLQSKIGEKQDGYSASDDAAGAALEEVAAAGEAAVDQNNSDKSETTVVVNPTGGGAGGSGGSGSGSNTPA